MVMADSELFKTKYASIAVTVAIVLMLVLSAPATAIRMGIDIDNTTPAQGEEITFTVTANISSTDRYVPMENFSLVLSKDGSTVRNVVFAPDGTILTGGSGISIGVINSPDASEYDYGYGEAMDDMYGYGYGTNYSFGYGYGYGYGYGAGGSSLTYSYNVTINTSSFDIGDYDAQVLLNTGNTAKSSFESLETSFTISSMEADISGYVEPNGTVNSTISITSASGNVTLTVPSGTIAKDSSGNALNTSITVGTTTANSTMDLALSSSESVVGKVVELGPAGATFDPYIQVRFDYDDADISGLDESTLGVKFYNTSSGLWEAQTVVERNTSENYIIANIEHFSDFAVVGTASSSTPSGSSSSGGSSGGGGGGGASGEKYENIQVKEVQNAYVYKDSQIVYEFSETDNPITSVQFYALTNSGRVAASIEVLRGRSSYADSNAPGSVYQQMNIWVGKSGVIDSGTAKDFVIDFKVEKSWLEENDIDAAKIRLYRYAGDMWNELPTSQVSDDGEYLHFESLTPGFSPFAIAAVDDSTGVDETISLSESDEDHDSGVEFGNETRESGDRGLPGFGTVILIVIIGIIVAAIYMYKKKGEE
ncbi:MAG: PGF-pre-PGF domain-containing protein [Methanolobus sp.]|nr:PGF-pre-PGF domain-containing protein [Methanolobus sp.]